MSRDTTNSATSPKPTGLAFLDEYAGHIGTLYDNSVLPLTSISGADTITASVVPALPSGGLAAGMKFTAVWDQNSTGAATLNIDGVGAKSIVAKDGSPLTSGQLAAGAMDMLAYDGTEFVLVTGGEDGAASARGQFVFDVTGVFDNSYPADTLIIVECWGAGAGGRNAVNTTGGSGGSYKWAFFRAGDLPSSVTITIPSGGAVNSDGGDCTFGSYVTAYGGLAPIDVLVGGEPGPVALGRGDAPDTTSGSYGGGRGGNGTSGSAPRSGGSSGWGGGGGGGGSTGVGGSSEFGGDGGDTGVSGSRPGGGGGANAAGGPGRCRVTVV